MADKDRKAAMDDFDKRAADLVDEMIATFDDPERAEERWRKSRKPKKA